MDTPTSLYEVRLGRGDSSLNRGVPGRPGRRPRSGVSAVSEARLTWSRRDSRDKCLPKTTLASESNNNTACRSVFFFSLFCVSVKTLRPAEYAAPQLAAPLQPMVEGCRMRSAAGADSAAPTARTPSHKN